DTIMSSIMSGGAASGNYGVGLIATINVRTVSWSLPFSYDLPTLSSFAYQNGPVSIETKLLIYGSGFSHNADYSARVRFRHTAAMATGWVSESSVVANAPFGIFKFHAIIV
ncbi:MAG: IPT/TIG domain-containing protein, partial [bacterium]